MAPHVCIPPERDTTALYKMFSRYLIVLSFMGFVKWMQKPYHDPYQPVSNVHKCWHNLLMKREIKDDPVIFRSCQFSQGGINFLRCNMAE